MALFVGETSASKSEAVSEPSELDCAFLFRLPLAFFVTTAGLTVVVAFRMLDDALVFGGIMRVFMGGVKCWIVEIF